MLHFSGGQLVAVGYVSLGGIGGSFQIDRVVIEPPQTADPDPATRSGAGS